MAYLAELHYFFDTKGVPLEKAVAVTAKAISRWCNGYEARLIWPKKGVAKNTRHGKLPSGIKKKEEFVASLVEWVFKNSELKDTFSLFLYTNYPSNEKEKVVAKFDHHDDTCCWALNLGKNEFSELKRIWEMNKLPIDLFYHESKARCIPNKKGLIAKNLEKVGFKVQSSTCYTPLRWKYRNKAGNSNKVA